MNEIDKLIVRTWSALVATGAPASAAAIAARAKLSPTVVAARLVVLAAQEHLPRSLVAS